MFLLRWCGVAGVLFGSFAVAVAHVCGMGVVGHDVRVFRWSWYGLAGAPSGGCDAFEVFCNFRFAWKRDGKYKSQIRKLSKAVSCSACD